MLGTTGPIEFGLLSFTLLLMFFAITWFHRLARRGSNLGLPRIGIDPGFFGQNLAASKRLFSTRGFELLMEAYRKAPGSDYVVQTEDMPRIVLSPHHLPELDMLPEDTLSHRESISLRHLGQFTGMDIFKQSHLHSDICRVHLRRNLPAFLPGMSMHVDKAMAEYFAKANTQGYTPVPAMGYSFFAIARIFSYVFVGEPLCEDKEWMQAIAEYPKVMMSVSATLRPWSPWLRPMVALFIKQSKQLKQYQNKLHRIFDPVIDTRRNSTGHNDALQWLVNLSAPHEADNHSILLKLMFLTLAAIHTSAMAMDHALLDLCASPEYIELLRSEAKEALRSTTGTWTLETISRLPRLDSFLQESRRYNHPAALAFHRLTLKDLKLKNGLVIPKGWIISMFAEALSRDGTYYKDPNTFDGSRFLSREASESENNFSRILPGNLSWGHGRFTCPGRWYADAQIKLIVAKTLISYDLRFKNGLRVRPDNLHTDERISPDPRAVIEVRKLHD